MLPEQEPVSIELKVKKILIPYLSLPQGFEPTRIRLKEVVVLNGRERMWTKADL